MEIPCDMLLHPELLTNEQLVYIIQQRHLRVPEIEGMARDDLLELFHRFCVPYGQRKYKDSGRGKVLNKTRRMSPERIPKLNTIDVSQNRKFHSNHDRVKPPPDLLSGHMKRIRLDKVSEKNNGVNGTKRKMSIDAVTPAISSPPLKKGRKPITWP
ncbi:uncharacterized protein LOC113229649 [Hyposmocoma kahamanoa]|uniref:uncharacterized protein LOC113229649 n=1 Tax=Hyposmocoma kahamanoa TaxID=1477025 RepID=UPI000E6D73A3|nr:uncharacterized protein LOC113229649 [Hyposmocoma kahamanoa]